MIPKVRSSVSSSTWWLVEIRLRQRINWNVMNLTMPWGSSYDCITGSWPILSQLDKLSTLVKGLQWSLIFFLEIFCLLLLILPIAVSLYNGAI